MRSWKSQGIIVCVLFALGAAGLLAQSPHKVTVPFKFMVNGVSYEPGTYYLSPQMGGARIEIRDEQRKPIAQLPVFGRLTAKSNAGKGRGTRLVFDETDAQVRHLSEIWIAGNDGFVVRTTGDTHTHVTASATQDATP
ncbi:MAG: hypothetical protein ACUVXB_04125 [Bryobacteraceae bacterium]